MDTAGVEEMHIPMMQEVMEVTMVVMVSLVQMVMLEVVVAV